MLKSIKIVVRSGILVAGLALVPWSSAQSADAAAPAPVPAQILSAKRVFISNGGVDAISLPVFQKEDEVDKPYNQFYAAMKAWGHYKLVDNPDDADQVFEVRFASAISSTGKVDTFASELVVTIVDAKTHFTLWTLAEPVEGAILKSNWDKNFARGIASLMADLKALTTPAAKTHDGANP